jgi:hypothetical protein
MAEILLMLALNINPIKEGNVTNVKAMYKLRLHKLFLVCLFF